MMGQQIDQTLEKVTSALERETPLLKTEEIQFLIRPFIKDKETYLNIVKDFGSPLYVFDEQALVHKAEQFHNAFKKQFKQAKCFYALKSNSHSFLIKTLVGLGYGIDVSSGVELKQALQYSPKEMIFSGPAKTDDELELACQHSSKVTILVDSFGELKRLQNIAKAKNVVVRIGIRLMIEENGLWRKFGIPLRRLNEFFTEANQYSHIKLCGLQFHASWNLDTTKQCAIIERLGNTFSELDANILKQIEFIDIGGGYWPASGEWIHPCATEEGRIRQCVSPQLTEGMDHRVLPSTSIEGFAQEISRAFERSIWPLVNCDVYLEPGRWISTDAMHILLQVIDKKADDVVIIDGGTNIVGWERYEMDYCPVVNLSNAGDEEHECMLFGSLCTPHDVWGYSYFGKGIKEGDVLLIPNQGAYTYSLRQNFIKALPREVILSKGACVEWK